MAFDERIALRSFQEISKLLSSTMELPEMLNYLLTEIVRVLGLKGGPSAWSAPRPTPWNGWRRSG